jgi:lysophospholipase L1-like esterase
MASVITAFCAYLLAGFLLLKLIKKLFPRSALLTNIQLFVVVLIGGLFVAELALRYVFKVHLSYPELNGDFHYTSPYRQIVFENFIHRHIRGQNDLTLRIHRPNSLKVIRKPEFTYTVQYNSLGLRGKEPLTDTNLLNIVALGDSYTEGVGAPADSTWVQLLEDQMNSSNCFEQSVQCINGGSSGSDPFYEWMIFKKVIQPFHPQIVILAMNESDITETIIRGGMERFVQGNSVSYRPPPWWEYVYSWSFIARSIAHRVFHLNYLLLTPQQYMREVAVAKQKLTDCLLQYYLPAAQQEHFKLIVVLHPKKEELLNHETPFTFLTAALRNNPHVTVVDLYRIFGEEFKNQPMALDSLYWTVDLHHTPAGYQLWAKTLSNAFEGQMCK